MQSGLYILGGPAPALTAAWPAAALRAQLLAPADPWAAVHLVPADALPPPDAALLYDVAAGCLVLAAEAAGIVLPILRELPADLWPVLAAGETPGTPRPGRAPVPAWTFPVLTDELADEMCREVGVREAERPFAASVLELVEAYLRRAGVPPAAPPELTLGSRG